MGRRFGSEENYFGQWNQPVQQPTGTAELPSTAVNANNAALALGERTANKFSSTSQRLAEEQAADTKENGKMLGEAVAKIPSAYQEGGRYNAEMAERQQGLEKGQQGIEQGQRNAQRDVAYGDTNARVASEQGQASLESTQTGTAATKAGMERSEKLLPGELAAQGQQTAMNRSTLDRMRIEAKQMGIETGKMEDEVAQNSIAAQVAQVRAGAPSPAEADRAEQDWLSKNSRAYTPAQVAAGRRLGRTATAQDQIVFNSATQSDPRWKESSDFKQKAAAAADAMGELKQALADYKNNSTLYSPDSPAAKEAQARVTSKLTALGQQHLLADVDMSSIKRAFMPGQSWTTTQALENAVTSTSRMLSASLVHESDRLKYNPFLPAETRNQYLQQVMYDPNAPGVQHDPMAKFNMNAPGPTGPIPVMNGAQITGKPDLRNSPGAVPLNQPQMGK